MPNRQDIDDAELSVLLSKAEPPKSPQHVDDYILDYARAEATINAPSGFLAVGKSWLNQNWVSAVATFSVAVIAVSISFQTFVPSGTNEIALTVESALGVAEFDANANKSIQSDQAPLTTEAANEEQEVEEQLATFTLALQIDNVNLPDEPQSVALDDNLDVENRQRQVALGNTALSTAGVTADAAVATLERESQAVSPIDTNSRAEATLGISLDQDDSADVAVATPARLIASDDIGNAVVTRARDELARAQAPQPASTASPNLALQQRVADTAVEEAVIAGGQAQVDELEAISAVANLRPDLGTLLVASTTAQQSLVIMLKAVLIQSDGDFLDADAEFPEAVAALTSAYDQLVNASATDEVVARYREARVNYADFELPESLSELMGILQSLEFPALQ